MSSLLRCTVLLLTTALAAVSSLAAAAAAPIDRRALVTRHNPRVTSIDPWAPLSVGNGQFCFTADVTGLQTFYDHYQKNGIPLETQARWAWHSNPNPQGYKLEDANRLFTAYDKTVPYPTNDRSEAGKWLRENPHAMPLPQIGFVGGEGEALQLEHVRNIDQTLDMWSGEIRSRFTLAGEPVEVSTVCAPGRDGIAVRVRSRALREGKLLLRVAFPRGYDLKVKNNPSLDWSQPESHQTEEIERGAIWKHSRDGSHYFATLLSDGAPLKIDRRGPHQIFVRASSDECEFTIWFSPGMPNTASAAAVRSTGALFWEQFWRSGAAIDFSGSTDPRARELERRVVLSQYLTAIQFAGDFPPQETGLTHSSWYGKHHTEMIWWHAAHFALWGRDSFLAKNLAWYVGALPIARALAERRGLRGARWAKMIGPDGRESPGGNPLIVWNQPHPIHLAELLYRNTPTPATLARYRELVQETAECMASMLHWDPSSTAGSDAASGAKGRYNLGPPLWIAQEIHDQATSMNPTYELSYWVRGLKIAQQWRERLNLPRDAEWDKRIASIAKLPVKDGKYVAIESVPDTWDNVASRHDHPSFLMALGQLPGDGVDRATMARTLDAVLTSWDWETKIWGWDYPMVAMTAARLGEPRKAVDILLFTKGPNNAYKPNGHVPQRGDLPVYLPANGALLAAVAMMAGGWDPPSPDGFGAASGAPTMDAPGFPKDGSWVVRSEGLKPLP